MFGGIFKMCCGGEDEYKPQMKIDYATTKTVTRTLTREPPMNIDPIIDEVEDVEVEAEVEAAAPEPEVVEEVVENVVPDEPDVKFAEPELELEPVHENKELDVTVPEVSETADEEREEKDDSKESTSGHSTSSRGILKISQLGTSLKKSLRKVTFSSKKESGTVEKRVRSDSSESLVHKIGKRTSSLFTKKK